MSTILQEKPETLDLQFVSEALIAMAEKDRERPCYSEREMVRRIEAANRREPVSAGIARYDGHEWLTQRECDALFSLARLTARQDKVLRQRLNGLTFEEIGFDGRHTKQGAQRIFIQALKKIARTYRTYEYVGLSEVYRQETSRGRRNRTSGTMAH